METSENINAPITELEFLCLLSSIMVIQNCSLVIDNNRLEQKLSLLYDNPKYRDLFRCFSNGSDIQDDDISIDLTSSFLTTYSYGILSPLEQDDGMKSTINISRDVAWSNINMFGVNTVAKMNDLSREINGKGEKSTEGLSYIKKLPHQD